jgi:hypothetical protein
MGRRARACTLYSSASSCAQRGTRRCGQQSVRAVSKVSTSCIGSALDALYDGTQCGGGERRCNGGGSGAVARVAVRRWGMGKGAPARALATFNHALLALNDLLLALLDALMCSLERVATAEIGEWPGCGGAIVFIVVESEGHQLVVAEDCARPSTHTHERAPQGS